MLRKQSHGATGFTLTEFLVLIGVGSLLVGVLLADLTQIRMKLLQQACAANLRQWAMAIDLYTKDFDGAYFHSHASDSFDDASDVFTNRYWPYLGGGNYVGTVRNMRICPAVAVRFTQEQIVNGTIHSYSIPIPQAKFVIPVYRNVDASGSPWYNSTNATLCPSLKYLPNPSQFLLLIESRGNNVYCGGLVLATTTGHSGSGGDPVPAINRHSGGAINCLFGDFHVELVSTQTLANVDAQGGCSGSTVGNPWFNMN